MKRENQSEMEMKVYSCEVANVISFIVKKSWWSCSFDLSLAREL